MGWVTAVLALIRLADTISTWLRENALIKEGQDQAIAAAAAAILIKTNYAKETMQQVSKLDSKQVDDVLKQLEG